MTNHEMTSREKLLDSLNAIGVDHETYEGRRVIEAAYVIIEETLQAKIKEGSDAVIAQERNNAWRQLRDVTKSLDGDVEEFIEYGISYGDELPRLHTFTPYYDVAMSDLANRINMHGTDMGQIRLMSRRNVMNSSPWSDAVRPAWNDVIDAAASL